MQSIVISVVAKETICHSQIIFTISKNSYAIHKKSSEMLHKGQRWWWTLEMSNKEDINSCRYISVFKTFNYLRSMWKVFTPKLGKQNLLTLMNDEYKHTLCKKFKFTFNSMLKSWFTRFTLQTTLFSTQPQWCQTLSWIELQMLLRCS